jgi:hypothetical protein
MFEPTFSLAAQAMGDDSLRMGHVGKVPDTQNNFLGVNRGGQQAEDEEK